jgi:hypothetical protein
LAAFALNCPTKITIGEMRATLSDQFKNADIAGWLAAA